MEWMGASTLCAGAESCMSFVTVDLIRPDRCRRLRLPLPRADWAWSCPTRPGRCLRTGGEAMARDAERDERSRTQLARSERQMEPAGAGASVSKRWGACPRDSCPISQGQMTARLFLQFAIPSH